jgi:hypothetical protein
MPLRMVGKRGCPSKLAFDLRAGGARRARNRVNRVAPGHEAERKELGLVLQIPYILDKLYEQCPFKRATKAQKSLLGVTVAVA